MVADFEDPSEAGVVAFDSIGFLAEEAIASTSARSGEPVSSPGTRDGGRGSSKRSSTRKPGSSRRRRREDVFHDEPERLWDAVLARLGPGYALLRTMPFDPSAN